ncbi:SidC homolog [Legionella londiniensis]|uniref:SidC homolog n=2 Tax=Legionella londiniensis TaxID=45068 RepID=A0A0W0VNG2_9GAMM|nr:hypothetical protein Llon_0779 [Legionella londiniensis]STX93385.1 SidC homolog [Legionella londiniensis]
MQGKFEFDKLPPELKVESAQNLSIPDLANLAQTSKYHLALFKPVIDVRKLLHHVVRGEYEAVARILKKDISLMFKRGKVKDCSGRIFDSISAFEYALWALDKHMWTTMLECVPRNKEGRKVLAKLLSQYNQINAGQVAYRLNGKTVAEKHFDFKNTIIKELQMLVDSINAPVAQDWSAIDKQWREGVGGAQRLLPMHAVFAYCSNEPFYPIPEFASRPKSSKQYYNWRTDKHENWFGVDSLLGVDFAIYKGTPSMWPMGGRACTGLAGACRWGVQVDLAALKALYETRTKDFINLKSKLEKEMALDNRYQAFQF